MTTDVQTTKRPSKVAIWIGRILSILPALLLLFSGTMKLFMPDMVGPEMQRLGYDPSIAVPLGILEIACTIIYLVPQTAVLGAILLTGYMGGAMNTHIRVGEPFITHIIIGVVLWLGVYLREPKLRAILPVRQLARGA